MLNNTGMFLASMHKDSSLEGSDKKASGTIHQKSSVPSTSLPNSSSAVNNPPLPVTHRAISAGAPGHNGHDSDPEVQTGSYSQSFSGSRPSSVSVGEKAALNSSKNPWNPQKGFLIHEIEISSVTLPPKGVKNVEEDRHQHTIFTLEVRLTSGLRWFVEKRYSDFRELHEKLKRSNPPVKQLRFPKRHVFRSKSQSVIQQRRTEFEIYLKEILAVRPPLRTSLFQFLEVHSHMESYERKRIRQLKKDDLERAKKYLSPEELDDLSDAFRRLCSSKVLMSYGTTTRGSIGTRKSSVSSPTNSQINANDSNGLSPIPSISKNSFRRDIFNVYPDMPPSFSTRFIKACSEKTRNDVSMDEFLRAMAILLGGSDESRLQFVYQMCDHDHGGNLTQSSLNNFLLCLHGRSFVERAQTRKLINDMFDTGRIRLDFKQFVSRVEELSAFKALTEWMHPLGETLAESPNPRLLNLQEEFNPIAQQKYLATETKFTAKEIAVLQDSFGQLRSCEGNEEIDISLLSDSFPLDVRNSMLRKVFSSFGKRANGIDIDIFSFVNALSIACRGTSEKKSEFAFRVFSSETQGNILLRDEFFAMLQYELSLKTDSDQMIWAFLADLEKKSNEDDNDASASTLSISQEFSTTLSGSHVGVFVDHVMKEFGSSGSKAHLTLEQFQKWAQKEKFELGMLDLIKKATFVNIGLRPGTPKEESDIILLCFKQFPDNPEDLIEDDSWYVINATWLEHWGKYVDFPYLDFLVQHSVSPPSETESLKSPFSMRMAAIAMPEMRSFNRTKTEPSYFDTDGNVIRPKHINNQPLLYRREGYGRSLRPKEEIHLGKHYAIISDSMWTALKTWYGGGPDIERTVIILPDGKLSIDLYQDEGDFEDGEDTEESLVRRLSSNTLIRKMRPGGSAGLSNLGNTCFLNSALQCLCNTGLLADYFLSGLYVDDINRTSPLGLQGKLAESYGRLMLEMWALKVKSLSPRDVKKTIGKYNESFRGNEQQDAQELLAFLLSGLSEDLNRIHEKPYVEQPDSDGRTDHDLADEWWRNHLRREVSIIVALFTGQYKSLLTCSTCGFKSARFEPFTFLQVPLPEPTHHNVNIRLCFSSGHIPRMVSLRMGINSTIGDLKRELVQLCNSQFKLNISSEDIKVAETSGTLIAGYKTDNRRLSQVRSIDRLVAYQLDRLSDELKDCLRLHSPNHGIDSKERTHSDELLRISDMRILRVGGLIDVKMKGPSLDYQPAVIINTYSKVQCVDVQYRSGDVEISVSYSRIRQRRPRLIYVPVVSRKLSYAPIFFKNPFRPTTFGFPELIRFCPERTTGYELYCRVWDRVKRYSKTSSPLLKEGKLDLIEMLSTRIDQLFSTSDSCGFILRRVETKGVTDSRSPWLTRSFGCVIPCTNDKVDILEDETIAIDWDAEIHHDKLDLDEMKKLETHASVAKNEALDKGPVPLESCIDAFTTEDSINELYCSNCRELREGTMKLDMWRLPPIMVIHLKRFQFSQSYRRKLSTLVNFPVYGLDLEQFVAPHYEDPEVYPTRSAPEENANDITETANSERKGEFLDETSREISYVEVESGRQAEVYTEALVSSSSSDTTPTGNKEYLNEESAPKGRIRRGYTDTNLEGARCLETEYDLYAVVNHVGALGGGHYTAYARNCVDGHWYYYDDERVRLIEESKVVTPAAYLLFYIRKDMKKVNIGEVYSNYQKHDLTEEDIDRIVEEGDQRKCSIM